MPSSPILVVVSAGGARLLLVVKPMPYAPLFELFPEVAAKETRSITILRPGDLPCGSYGFVEMFCNEEGCDCRRAFIQVHAEQTSPSGPPNPLATISFGWEDKAFYRKWASYPLSKEQLLELKGPALVTLAPQSDYAPVLLGHFKTLIKDDVYVARIVRHYEMFRDAIGAEEPKPALTLVRSEPKPGRNQPCPCGSGVKYKKCCLGKVPPRPARPADSDDQRCQ